MIDITITQAASASGRSDHSASRPKEGSQADYHRYCPGETWKPDVNLYEDDENYYVIVDLSGSGSQSIEVHYHEGDLIIAGHRPTPPPPDCVGELRLHHMEIDHGQFQRALRMPTNINVDRIDAIYRTGQLLITVPKKD